VKALRAFAVAGLLLLAAGCVSLPPAAQLPKPVSHAFDASPDTRLGRTFEPRARLHEGESGFRLLSAGIDGLWARVEMIDAAQRSLDVQSYIFRADESGSLIAQSLVHAADRGVRVRVLIDDAETVPGDERILALAAHVGIEVRIFNPLRYRGHIRAWRGLEFLFNKRRLDYRMHNKLMVADDAVAILGGRNIGDQYFQIDPESQFGDADVVVAGPIVQRLSGAFDEFWNGPLAIPAQAIDAKHTSAAALAAYAARLGPERERLNALLPDATAVAAKQPFTDIVADRTPLLWAHMKLMYDSPDKKDIDQGRARGRLIYRAVEDQARAVTTELQIVTPYFIPSPDELAVLEADRARDVRVRVLTNSLKAAPNVEAHSGYMHYRVQLLRAGVELYEERALLGSVPGSGQTGAISRHGNFGLHAKMFVFDRTAAFLGSMNFDQRSKHLNTEIGLLILSPALAQQIAARFDALTQPDNAYAVSLVDSQPARPHLQWTAREAGKIVHTDIEPARSEWQRLKAKLLSLLPLDDEL
jgi:putative cardiolipin synthase